MARRTRGQDTPDFQDTGSTPVPDPTKLTTDAVNAATAQWRRDLNSMQEIITTRLEAMDEATKLRVVQMEHQLRGARELLLSEIARSGDISKEKFEAVNARFTANDMAAQQTADERRISLDAALAAAKEAVAEQQKANAQALEKSERAQAEQNRSVALLLQTSIASLEDKIADLRSSRDSGIGTAKAVVETRGDSRAAIGTAVALGSLLVVVIGLIISLTIGK